MFGVGGGVCCFGFFGLVFGFFLGFGDLFFYKILLSKIKFKNVYIL